MARFEWTTDSTFEGGRSTMSEEALQVIEDYLTLVRRHLPHEIADDVISELRAYIVEAAEEMEEGTLTVKAAKKTVARFGAPSEVAEEYRYSMMFEEDEVTLEEDIIEEDTSLEEPTPSRVVEPTAEQTHVALGPATQHEERVDSSIKDEKIKVKSGTHRVDLYIETFFKALVITMFWSIGTAIASLLASPIIILIDLAFGFSFLFLYLFFTYISGKRLEIHYYEEWPEIQKFVTLPKGLFPEPSKISLSLDIIFMVFFATITFAAALLFLPLIAAIPLIILTPLLLIRAHFLIQRMNTPDPLPFIRREFILQILILVVTNFSAFTAFFATVLSPWYGWELVVTLLISPIHGYMLLLLVGSTQDLWWEFSEVEEPSPETTESALIQEQRIPTPPEEAVKSGAANLPKSEVDVKEEETIEDRSGLPVSGKRIVLKALLITLFWLLITLVSSVFIAAPYLLTFLLTMLFGGIHLLGSMGAHAGSVSRIKNKYGRLWSQGTRSWSRLRQIFTFPERMYEDETTIFLRMETIVTFFGLAITALFLVVMPAPTEFQIISWIFVAALLGVLTKLNHRWNNRSSSKYNYLDFFSTLVALATGYAITTMIANPYFWVYFSTPTRWEFTSWFVPFWFVYGTYLLYTMIPKTQKLWSSEVEVLHHKPTKIETRDEETKEEKPIGKKREVLEIIRSSASNAIGRTFGWFAVVMLLPIILVLLGIDEQNYSQLPELLFTTDMLYLGTVAFLTAAFVGLYFVVRYLRVESGRTDSILGKRGRIESVIDIVILALFSTYLMTNVENMMRYIREIMQGHYSSSLSWMIIYLAFLVAFLFLILGMIFRFLADILNLISPKFRKTSTFFVVSGYMLVIASGIFYSTFPLVGYHFIIWSSPFLFILLLPLVIFQIITNQLKMNIEEDKEAEDTKKALDSVEMVVGPEIIESR